MNFNKILGIFIINIAFLISKTNAFDLHITQNCDVFTNDGVLVAGGINNNFYKQIVNNETISENIKNNERNIREILDKIFNTVYNNNIKVSKKVLKFFKLREKLLNIFSRIILILMVL